MSLKIEPRRGVSWQMLYATPPLAVALTILTGFFLFFFMGYNPFKALMSYFISPLLTFYGLSELAVKAAPLITIAVGLFGGYAAVVAVFLAIAGFSPRRTEPVPAVPSEEAAS